MFREKNCVISRLKCHVLNFSIYCPERSGGGYKFIICHHHIWTPVFHTNQVWIKIHIQGTLCRGAGDLSVQGGFLSRRSPWGAQRPTGGQQPEETWAGPAVMVATPLLLHEQPLGSSNSQEHIDQGMPWQFAWQFVWEGVQGGSLWGMTIPLAECQVPSTP